MRLAPFALPLALAAAALAAACAQEEAPAPKEQNAPERGPVAAPENAEAVPGSQIPGPEMFAPLLADHDVPGMVMAVIAGCEVQGIVPVGTAVVESGTPVTEMTAFEAASLSKPVFAWLVMTLVDEGTIDLDRPIAEDFDWPRIADKDAYRQITPRMILTHRTGLPNWAGDSLDFQRSDPLAFEAAPGSAYSYSGEAFQLLQAFVEEKTGKSLQTLFEERLGAVMPQSTFAAPLPGGVVPSRAYRAASRPETARDLRLAPKGESLSAASLVTVAADYAAFLGMVCRGEGLSEEIQAEMLRAQSAVPPGENTPPSAYGLGFQLAQMGDESLVFHSGNNDEYRAFAGYERTTGDGVVLFANGANGWQVFEPIIAPD